MVRGSRREASLNNGGIRLETELGQIYDNSGTKSRNSMRSNNIEILLKDEIRTLFEQDPNKAERFKCVICVSCQETADDLRQISSAWSEISEPIKSAILTLAKSSNENMEDH